ncbi:MAG: hypothetical protein JWQ89_102 [Devosia sp.]|uniref:hypothetical protein n=1 Tax=Devosia sp. TaxID=1871048 RepID=UPI0026285CBD|nr:hypothetical protein [Devosia sp.]MDB5538375.1 hypothetical protein [Devosia sp.]
MRGMVLSALLAVLASAATSSLAQDESVELMVYVEPSGTAKSAYVSSGADEIAAILPKDALSTPIAFRPGTIEDLPMSLTIEWDDQNSTSLPAFVFAPYSGKKIAVRVYRYDFTLEDADKAEDLCWHTQPTDVKSAFRSLFGCQEWVKLIESNDEKWTNAHLKGLRGWFAGSYYLFTKVRPIHGLGLSPWGLQPELVDRLQDILTEIDEGRERQESFEPLLRIADIRQALTEFNRWELRLYGLIPALIEAKKYTEAGDLNDRVRAAYERYAGPLATEAIDGVSRENLENNAALLKTLLVN